MNRFSWADPSVQTAFPIARPGYPMIFASAFITAVFAILGFAAPAMVFMFITLCVCLFFRDPDRVVPDIENALVSPADGRIIAVEEVDNTRFYDRKCLKVSIFMSVFNVHVNRIPYSGTVTKALYYPGKFFRANLDKASRKNEHNAICLETEKGELICFVQIAGLIARRIISKVQANDKVTRGQRFGLICFGSRVDLYLPVGTKLDISVGDKVKSGTSIVGYLR